jgi:hypothetical protein
MVFSGKLGPIANAVAAAMLLGGCNQIGGDSKQDAPQKMTLSGPVSGGRNAAASPAAAAQPINFGDDSGDYSKDGECDDKRFSGPGMTNTPLLEADVGHDATDCRTAYEQKRLTLASTASPLAARSDAAEAIDRIQWGDDSSKFSRDGECDDKRFEGAGLTSTPLLDSDIKHDATDCRAAFALGRLKLRE